MQRRHCCWRRVVLDVIFWHSSGKQQRLQAAALSQNATSSCLPKNRRGMKVMKRGPPRSSSPKSDLTNSQRVLAFNPPSLPTSQNPHQPITTQLAHHWWESWPEFKSTENFVLNRKRIHRGHRQTSTSWYKTGLLLFFHTTFKIHKTSLFYFFKAVHGRHRMMLAVTKSQDVSASLQFII